LETSAVLSASTEKQGIAFIFLKKDCWRISMQAAIILFKELERHTLHLQLQKEDVLPEFRHHALPLVTKEIEMTITLKQFWIRDSNNQNRLLPTG
jgi:hypothetical protein